MTVTMAAAAVKRRTSPQDWIQDYYSPVMTVLAHEDVEIIANKNNLTFTELLQPFSKMLTDVTIKDVDGTNHNVPSLNIILQDFKKDPQKQVNQKLMLDRVGEENVPEKDLISKHFPKLTLEAPGYTPWFDTWMKFYLASLPIVEHEYLKHHLGCMFAVSTTTREPVEALRSLVSQQQRQQHERSGNGSSYPQYLLPNMLKYYVLVHDSYSSVDDAMAAELFTSLQNAFDSANCHFLQVNSRAASEEPGPMAEHWFAFTHRWVSVETRRGKSFSSGMATGPTPPRPGDPGPAQDPLSHPLAGSGPESLSPTHTPVPRLTQATPASVARLLSPNDVDRVRILVRELVIKCLIPYVEKQLRLLHEVVTNRKSRSLFSGAKRWFGTNKGSPSGGTSVVYSREAPELQVRKLADLYFLMRMYKPAYNYAYISKKDFQTDEAWPYYAAAAELAALAMFMLSSSDPGKKYRPDYMEDAIAKYLTLCQAPEFAVRATLFDGLCLKHQSLFTEAAASYIKMTNELSDLRSAMLLEQAAYCYLLAQPASVRKYGFHIVLAGYRFSKTGGCKRHAARLYRQGAQVYEGTRWQLSAEHILYTLGHTKFMLRDFAAAADFFNSLMEQTALGEGRGAGHLQQMVHLREFFLVQHARAKEEKGAVLALSLPRLLGQLTEVRLAGQQPSPGQLELWQPLERAVKEVVWGQDIPSLASSCQPAFTDSTTNQLAPQARAGEQMVVTVTLENPFGTPLQLRGLQLLWRFQPEGSEVAATEGGGVESGPADTLTLERGAGRRVELAVCAARPGQLTLLGIEYSLKALFPDKEPTDHEVRGRQLFTVVPRNVNVQKERKYSTVPGIDRRLEVAVVAAGPRLEAALSLPCQALLAGELRCAELELTNAGGAALDSLHLACTSPGLVSFGRRAARPGGEASVFELPLVQDQGRAFRRQREDGTVEQASVELVPVPLPDSLGGVLQPGASTKLALWVRGPSLPGPSSHSLLLYYDSVIGKNKASPRLTPLTLELTVQPSLEAACTALSLPCTALSLPCTALSLPCTALPGPAPRQGVHHRLRLTNASKDLAASLDTIEITQVTLVSRSLELSPGLQSSPAGLAVARGETNTLSLQSGVAEPVAPLDLPMLQQLPASVAIDGGRLHFSSLLAQSGPGQPVHSPPFIDFLREHFVYHLGRRGNPPLLREDLAVVMWRTHGPAPRMGQAVVPVVQEEPEEEEEPAAPSYPATVAVAVEPVLLHDFTASPLACVPVGLRLEAREEEAVSVHGRGPRRGEGREEGVLLEYRLGGQARGVRVAGSTSGRGWLERGGPPLHLALGLAVSRPGLYTVSSWTFRARRTADPGLEPSWTSDEVFQPVEISFEVRQRSCD